MRTFLAFLFFLFATSASAAENFYWETGGLADFLQNVEITAENEPQEFALLRELLHEVGEEMGGEVAEASDLLLALIGKLRKIHAAAEVIAVQQALTNDTDVRSPLSLSQWQLQQEGYRLLGETNKDVLLLAATAASRGVWICETANEPPICTNAIKRLMVIQYYATQVTAATYSVMEPHMPVAYVIK